MGSARWTAMAVVMQALALSAAAQPLGPALTSEIYVCVDEQGRRLTSDRPLRECMDRPQRVLNTDGSQRGVRQPSPTAEERAARLARERKEAEEVAARAEVVRRDRFLLSRYRNEAAHQSARESALDPVRLTMDLTESRLAQLQRERRALEEEARAPRSREQAAALKLQLEANEVAAKAQRENTLNQKAELDRINRIFDIELERLRRLWAGEVPGSMGAMESPAPDTLARVGAYRAVLPKR